jgi:type VI secretion system protein ImpA
MGSSLDITAFSGPVTKDNPGGEDLEQTPFLAEFESQRLFGQMSPLSGDLRRESDGPGQPKVIDWRKVRDRSAEALARSRDLRVLPYLAAATIRLEGLVPFLGLFPLIAQWLKDLPDDVYPRFDGDGIAQANALSSWADPMAVAEPFRRTPFIKHRQLGAFSLRDLDLAQGKISAPGGDTEPTPESQIMAAINGAEQADLEELSAAGAAALESIDYAISSMRDRTQGAATPDLGRIRDPIKSMTELVTAEIALRNGGGEAVGAEGGAGAPGSGPIGSIRSRQDAIRALNAVAAYFREQEPSSAVPIFVDRATRLIGLDFLEMMSDVAPDALTEIRHVGGLRD